MSENKEKTKEIAIDVEYNGKNYTSDFEHYTEDEEHNLDQYVKRASKGVMVQMDFSLKNKRIYFPQNILKNSIITLIYK